MKRVISVSLGTSKRDHTAQLSFGGETIRVERRGTNGDLGVAAALIRDLDHGRETDAIGLGGIDLYLAVGGTRYIIRDATTLKAAATHTPVVDGSGLKRVWEPQVVADASVAGILRCGQTVLMVSALDRFPMAQALVQAGLVPVFGDLMFSSRIDYPIRTLEELEELARKLLPEITKLPFSRLYPTGVEQERTPDPRFTRYFDEADVLAGDFHYIRRYMPERLDGKVVLTNTTTPEDVDMLAQRGVQALITTTPRIGGRTFGTNAIEASLVAHSGIMDEDPRWAAVVSEAGIQAAITRF